MNTNASDMDASYYMSKYWNPSFAKYRALFHNGTIKRDPARGLCVRVSMSALIGETCVFTHTRVTVYNADKYYYIVKPSNLIYIIYKLTVGSGRRSCRNGHPAEGANKSDDVARACA